MATDTTLPINAGNSSSAYNKVDERVSARHAMALTDKRWRSLC
jgi:hypothetical protein